MQYYKDAIQVIKEDVTMIQQSLEESEVVTDSSIFLRSSIDRLSLDKEERVRRRSSVSQSEAAAKREERKRHIVAQFRFSYVVDACYLHLQLDASQYHAALLKSALYVDATELQLDCQSVAFAREGTDAVEIVRCDERAFSAVVTYMNDLSGSVVLSNCEVVFDMSVIRRLVDESLSFASSLRLPSAPTTPASPKERSPLKLLLVVNQPSLLYRLSPTVLLPLLVHSRSFIGSRSPLSSWTTRNPPLRRTRRSSSRTCLWLTTRVGCC